MGRAALGKVGSLVVWVGSLLVDTTGDFIFVGATKISILGDRGTSELCLISGNSRGVIAA